MQNKEYKSWVKDVKKRYFTARLKASVEANRTLSEYYRSLCRDIADRQYGNIYRSNFYITLSNDLKTDRNVLVIPIIWLILQLYGKNFTQASASSIVVAAG